VCVLCRRPTKCRRRASKTSKYYAKAPGTIPSISCAFARSLLSDGVFGLAGRANGAKTRMLAAPSRYVAFPAEVAIRAC